MAVEAGRGRVGDGRVVREGLDPVVVEGDAELGDGEVVDPLVIVGLAVGARRRSDVGEGGERQVLHVLRPLVRDAQRDGRARHLGIGVDRVTEVDVEEVVLGDHRRVDLEVVEGGHHGHGVRLGIGVACEPELDRAAVLGVWGRTEASHAALLGPHREAVVVDAIRRQPRHVHLDGVVVRGVGHAGDAD